MRVDSNFSLQKTYQRYTFSHHFGNMDNLSIIEENNIEKNSIEALQAQKSALWKMLLLSAGFDIAMFFVEIPLDFQFLGTPIVVDEIMGFFLSKWAAGTNIDLKMRYRIIGLLPIPGVTAISLQCTMELWKIYKKLK